MISFTLKCHLCSIEKQKGHCIIKGRYMGKGKVVLGGEETGAQIWVIGFLDIW